MRSVRATLSTLVLSAHVHGRAEASGGRWVARRHADGGVDVWHYQTLMVTLRNRHGYWYAAPMGSGWGSQTDKVGVGKVLRGCQCVNAGSYRELWGV